MLPVAAVLARTAYVDYKRKRIPNRYPLFLLCSGVLYAMSQPMHVAFRATGALAGAAPLLLVALIRPGAMGGGDIKLMAAGGCLLGPEGVLKALALGFGIAGAQCAYLLATRRAGPGDALALGPALCMGLWLAFF